MDAAQFVVVTHSGGGWLFTEADSILINGKEKVRSVALSTPHSDTWDSKSIGRLADVPLESFSVIQRTPDGKLLARSEQTAGWQLLLPDNVKEKAAQSGADIWRSAAVSLKADRKDKAPVPIHLSELYAIVPGQDPALSTARFVTDVSFHTYPTVEAGPAFRQMLELIPPAVKKYSSGPSTESIRDYIRTEMSRHLQQWQDGDAPVSTLEDGLLLAKVSEAAFPSDTAQANLRKQTAAAKASLDRRVAILRALHAGKLTDAFLASYRDFEPYDRSFPDLAAARRAHRDESALAHLEAARRLRQDGDYVNSIRNLRLAQLHNPGLAEAGQLLEEVRLEVARLSAQKFAEGRRGLDPRSPAHVQMQRRLLLAEQYVDDNNLQEAEQTLQQAEASDKDEPKLKFVEARLAIQRGDLGMAVALLDQYAGLALTPQDFEEGEKLRAGIQYKIDNTRSELRNQLTTLYSDQRFASALQTAAGGLKLDNEESSFLFQASVNACLVRHCGDATPLLHRFLDLTDSTQSNREQRLIALKLLRQGANEPATTADAKAVAKSWFSGESLDRGVFYDPVSLAFQPKISRVNASDHLTVNYEWSGYGLRAVHARYEEKKTGSNIAKLALGVAAASQGVSLPISWRTNGRETNDFYFNYYEDAPQIFNVSRDNVVVKSQKIPISIPSFGGFGPFGGLGSLAGLGGLLAGGGLKGLGGMAGLGGMPGLGGMAGLGGMPGLAGAGRLGGISRLSGIGGGIGSIGSIGGIGSIGAIGGVGGRGQLGALSQLLPAQNYSVHADPQGSSTNGFLTLWNSPRVDTRLTYKITGKRVAVGFSGNHFFHPFAWDAIHMFELDYDDEGRVLHAWELDQPNAPRLDFTWDGKRLMSVTGRATTAGEAIVYSRTLTYSGDKLVSETITHAGKSSHIQYKYNKQGALIEAESDADPSIDGRSRKVEFVLDETSGKGKS
jgi:hypothetical protein